MDLYKEQYPEELEQFYEDEKFKLESIELDEKAKRVKSRVKWLESRRQETREKIKVNYKENQDLQSKKISISKDLLKAANVDFKDVLRIEKYFKDVTNELGTTTLQFLINKIASDQDYSISNKILVNQLAEIEKDQYDHIMKFNNREEEIVADVRKL